MNGKVFTFEFVYFNWHKMFWCAGFFFLNVAQFSKVFVAFNGDTIISFNVCLSLLMFAKENNSNNNNSESVLAPIQQTATTNAKQLNESFMHHNHHSTFNTELHWIQMHTPTQPTNIIWTMQAGRETRGGENLNFES